MRRALLAAALAASAGASGAADDEMAIGRRLFAQGVQPACAVCHTLHDAGAAGSVGPSLDELKPDAARVANALRNGVGAMPSYKSTLSDAQIGLLARYVERASSAQKY